MTGGVARVLELEAREELEDRGLALGSRTYQVKLPININYFKYFFFASNYFKDCQEEITNNYIKMVISVR